MAHLSNSVFVSNQSQKFQSLRVPDGIGQRCSNEIPTGKSRSTADVYTKDSKFTPGFVTSDLRPVLKQTALKTLQVDRLGIGDELMTEVVAAGDLQVLGVSGLPIADAGLQSLRHLMYLQLLNIPATPITIEAATTLHEDTLPGCEITDNWCCECVSTEPQVP